jgi:hypothetical protein
LLEVKGSVKQRMRIAALLPAYVHVVQQRVHLGLGHIRVLPEIKGGIEQAMRITAFLPAKTHIVFSRVHVEGQYIWVRR